MVKKIILLVSIVSLRLLAGGSVTEAEALETIERPRVEVVFCLDTTGSMGGLIEGAKQKIWSIANQIVKGKPTPELHIGLVGYRDKGDDYVTKIFALNDDLDGVFENLMSFSAGGGGDTPEHVNKALNDAVHEIDWSEDTRTLKLIFLVGDCPPHMDYQDGYDYHKICQEAVKRDIVINTVQCGSHADTEKFWQEIARLGEGKYARVAQTGGMKIIDTPMDSELAKLNAMLEETIVTFGTAEVRAKAAGRLALVKEMEAPLAAERAAYKSVDSEISDYDLIEAIKDSNVRLEDIKDEELPEEMRRMSLEERREYLARKQRERQELKARIKKLSERRDAYLASRLKGASHGDSFDEVVQELIKEQAAGKGISY